jgi:hypothetical protein
MQANSWSASSLVMLKPRASYMLMTACVSINRVLFDMFSMCATVQNLIHCEMV